MAPDPAIERRAAPTAGGSEPVPFPPEGDGQALVYRDDLTGLHNRRALNFLFAERWSALLAAHGEVALLILDLDLFKEVNDTWGHLTGDEVLRRVAGLLRTGFRDSDLLVRYGGDEFVVALPGVGPEEARRLAERTREALRAESFGGSGAAPELAVSFSIGVASAPADGSSGELVLHAADRRLYEEKRLRQSAPAPAVARGSRWNAPLALVAAFAGVALLAWLLSSRGAPEPAAAQPAAPAALAADTERERLVELQAEVERLREELAEARRRGESGEAAERRRLELEERLRLLTARAADLTAAAPPPADRAPSAEPSPSPPVRPAAAPPVVVGEPQEADTESGSGASLPPIVSFTPPELVSVVRPSYPPAARRLRRTATVELRVRIDREGRVTDAEPLGPPVGLGFDQAARDAALRAVYRPARRNGVAVEGEARLAVLFDLQGRE